MIRKLFFIGGAAFLLPALAFAQNFGKVDTFFTEVQDLVTDILIPLVFAIAILVFFWGVIKFVILGATNEDKRAEGRQLMIYAVIAFFVMTALWGIVTLLGEVIGVDDGANVNLPNIPQ